MADTKISALPASTTPLAGTEVLPIVQSSTTKKVAVSDLTAGRDVAGLSFTGGNIKMSGNTVQAQDTNGSISVLPNGTGFTKVKLENYSNTAGEVGINNAAPQATLAQLTLGAGTWLLTSRVGGVVSSGLGTPSSDQIYGINTAASIPAWNSSTGASNRSYIPQSANTFTMAGGTVTLQTTISGSTTFYLYGGPSSISATLSIALKGYLTAVKISE